MSLYLAGAQLLELFPIVPIIGNVTLGVGALSYAGQLNLTVVADDEACPDPDVFISGVQLSLAELTDSVAASQDLRHCATDASDRREQGRLPWSRPRTKSEIRMKLLIAVILIIHGLITAAQSGGSFSSTASSGVQNPS